MVGAHLAAPVGGQAADLEALLVKVHAGLGVVHVLVILRQAVCVCFFFGIGIVMLIIL